MAVGMGAQWNLGSNTKAMTATVAGMLVEDSLLRSDSTIGEVLSESAPEMDAGHQDTTPPMLHRPYEGGEYGMGWVVTERDWAGGRALTHGGSNTLWFATVWIAPEKDMAFFAVTNAGGDKAFEAVDKAIGAMIGRHLPG